MRIIPIAGDVDPILTPDLLWNGVVGDVAVDTSTADLQRGQALATAVGMCLLTDRRVDRTELPEGERNRGWPGDGFDLQPGEPPLGSKLWLLRRRALTEGIELEAEDYAREALQTLIDQQVCVRVDVVVARLPALRRLDLDIALYGRDGAAIYQGKYAVLWEQVDGL
ncbi:phage GP46 family protein [Paracoccus sp. (in: a-proteobacteria)]|uniref:phage GP46 family protein n=1 Tax=Paracoccus sp. TaxID=267 RepID=UPI002AFF2307|nr:phage GP46 family protein [Paracoccus sp. (in: a-proteobacteria)]